MSNIAMGRGYNESALVSNIHNQYAFYQSGRPVTGVNYVNRNAPHAFTAVSAQAFAGAQNVQHNRVAMSPQQIATASAIAPTALQRPTPASFGQSRLVDARPLPAAGFNRQVVAVSKPSPAINASASFRAGQPASNVRVLGGAPSAAAIEQARVTRSAATPTEVQANPRPGGVLPQVPHFEPAHQIQQVQQAPHYAPQPYQQSEQQIEQQRFEAAERSHEYVPEQRQIAPDPSYQPYRSEPAPQPYSRPEYSHPEQEAHPQNAPKPHASAPAAHSSNQNQH
jgi:hypothetical protein